MIFFEEDFILDLLPAKILEILDCLSVMVSDKELEMMTEEDPEKLYDYNLSFRTYISPVTFASIFTNFFL